MDVILLPMENTISEAHAPLQLVLSKGMSVPPKTKKSVPQILG